jgi:hypothetical protein
VATRLSERYNVPVAVETEGAPMRPAAAAASSAAAPARPPQVVGAPGEGRVVHRSKAALQAIYLKKADRRAQRLGFASAADRLLRDPTYQAAMVREHGPGVLTTMAPEQGEEGEAEAAKAAPARVPRQASRAVTLLAAAAAMISRGEAAAVTKRGDSLVTYNDAAGGDSRALTLQYINPTMSGVTYFITTAVMVIAACYFAGCCCGLTTRPLLRALRRGIVAAIYGNDGGDHWCRDVSVMSMCTYERRRPEPRFRHTLQGFVEGGMVECGAPYLRRRRY